MKNVFLLAVLITLPSFLYAQIEETLRPYRPGGRVYYTSTEIDMQMARFEAGAPCYIKSITVQLTGGTGDARVRLFGYETGSQVPELQNDIIPPIPIQKTIEGTQSIVVELPEPVWFDNSWFWVCIDQMSSGMFLLSDNVEKEVPYDLYFYQVLHTTNPQQEWAVGALTYIVDVLVSYPTKTSEEIMVDVTDHSGFEEELPSLCIAAADFDEDNYIDLFLNNKLYRNNRNGSFRDVTRELGVANNYNSGFDRTWQCQSFVDLDNDGDLDILSFGPDTSLAFINNEGTFEEKLLSLPPFPTFGYSPLLFNWADLNYDGYPDLFAGQQASKYGENGPDILPSFLFMNNQNNDFTDESSRIFPFGHVFRRARASQFGDFDNDGDLDLYIANYFLERDQLYENDGEGYFTDVSPAKNLDIHATASQHGCGVNMFDYDNDMDLDIIVARIAHARFVQYDHRGTVLYRNEGPPDFEFTDLTGQYNDYPGQVSPIGLEYEDYHSSAAFADVNNDGLADLLLKTYNPYRFVSFYEQQPDHSFKMARFKYGLDRLDARQAGQVWLDYNNDGKIDLTMIHTNKVCLYKNTLREGSNSIELNLKCTSGNKFAIGARAYVHAGDNVYTREVTCGQDEWVQFPYRLHIGVGDAETIDSVVVHWPVKPQVTDVFEDLPVNNLITLTEGGGISLEPVGVQYARKYDIITSAAPNPFAQRSVIKYNLEEYNSVSLRIYDGSGSEIRSLVDEFQSPGEHEAVFDASGLPSGSYFYKLIIGKKTAGNQLILIK